MIDLTPLEVRKKKGDFRRSMRGYEQQAVDDFIDLVADRLEQLVRENVNLHDRVSSIESQVADYRERERALTEALVTAQEMREEMRKQIEREVDLKRREAEADADAIRAGANQMREREEENIRRLRARQTQFVQSYRAFLERELAEIGVMAQTLELPTDETSTQSRKRPKRAEPGDTSGAAPPRATQLEADIVAPVQTPVVPAAAPPVAPPAAAAPPEPAEEIVHEPFVAAPAPSRPAAARPAAPKPAPPRPAAPAPAPAAPAPAPSPAPAPVMREPVPMPLPVAIPEPETETAMPDLSAVLEVEDVRIEEEPDSGLDDALFDLAQHLPGGRAQQAKQPPADLAELEEDIPEIELLEEEEPRKKKDEEEPDGWVSSLLEGKGD